MRDLRGAKIALGLASVCLGVLLGEILLSWVDPQVSRRSRVWQFDPDLGWEHIASSTGWMVGPEYEVEIRINADGLRDRSHSREKEAGTRRVLVFGDSFVEGWGVRLEDSVSKLLEENLQQRSASSSVEVINFGVAGFGTDQEMLLFEKLGSQYRPDQVLVFFYANDLANNSSRMGIGAERGYKPQFRLGRNGQLFLTGVPVKKVPFWDEDAWRAQPWKRRLGKYLYEHWHLYVLLHKVLAPAEVKAEQRQMFYESLYGKGYDPRIGQAWELTGRLLQSFKEKVVGANAQLLLVYVPAIVQVEEENWTMKRDLYGLIGEFDLRKPNRELARLAARYDIPMLDLNEEFARQARRQILYFRESHWNPQGHALAARLVADYLDGREQTEQSGE